MGQVENTDSCYCIVVLFVKILGDGGWYSSEDVLDTFWR